MLGVGIPQAGGDRAAPIASLRSEALIAQFVAHQVHEKLRDTSDVHASFVRALRETIAGQRGDYDIKCVLLGAAMTGWIGERLDNLVHFKKGAGPAMRDNQRHGMWSFAFDMQKVQTKAVNGSLKLRETIQQAFLRAPVVGIAPVGDQLLEIVQVRPIVPASTGYLVRPAGALQALLQIAENVIIDLDRKCLC